MSSARKVLAVIALALAALLVIRMFREPNSIVARQQLDALLSGNSRTLLQSATSLEIQEEELTEAKVNAVWKRLIEPRLAKVKAIGEPETQTYAQPVRQARASVRVKYSNGYIGSIYVIANITENGPKRAMLSETLATAWRIDKQSTQTTMLTEADRRNAMIDGLTRDRAALQEIGLKGLWSPMKGLRTWDELRREFERSTAL